MMAAAEAAADAGPSLPLRTVVHRRHHVRPPAHHVVQPANTLGQTVLESFPLVATLRPTENEHLYSTEKTSVFLNAGPALQPAQEVKKEPDANEALIRTGFQNPWPSWHKPTIGEYWNGLHWIKDGTGGGSRSYDHEASSELDEAAKRAEMRESSGQVVVEEEEVQTMPASNASELTIEKPDFNRTIEDDDFVRATWLGHASVLMQLPAFEAEMRPVNILFDPIFSYRCSPSQFVGPARTFPAPCEVDDLPPIDVVCISHSHYDHLDYTSIVRLWKRNAEQLQFAVPLGLRTWFLGLGLDIDEDRVVELDWWDEIWLQNGDEERQCVRIVCTPAQHGSGRYGLDANRSLWCSWFVERRQDDRQAFRAFFGGDTGYRFHAPAPSTAEFPACPAFEDIQRELGSPQLSFLPISVGATLNFVKSYDVLNLVPQLDSGLTAANHMTPMDAVRVAKAMSTTGGKTLAMAIHYGTFVRDLKEVQTSIDDLQHACKRQQVQFTRQFDERHEDNTEQSSLAFACVNHGQSVWIRL